MTIDQNTVIWMFFAVVVLAALAIVTNYAIVRVVLTGKAWAFERRNGEHRYEALPFDSRRG